MIELKSSMAINQIIYSIINTCYLYNKDFVVEKNKNIVNIYVDDYKFVLHYYENETDIIITRITADQSISIKDFANLHEILRGV